MSDEFYKLQLVYVFLNLKLAHYETDCRRRSLKFDCDECRIYARYIENLDEDDREALNGG